MKYKRIIALMCSFVIVLNIVLFRSSATGGGFLSYVATTLIDFALAETWENGPGAAETTWAASNDPCSGSPTGHHDFQYTANPRPGAPEFYQDTCQYCGVTYSSFYDTAYGTYVQGVEEEYGTSTFSESGLPVFYPSGWEMYDDFLIYFDEASFASVNGGFMYSGFPYKTISNYKKFGVRSYFTLPAGVYELWIDSDTLNYTNQTYLTFNKLYSDGSEVRLCSTGYISKDDGFLNFTLSEPSDICFSVGAYLIIQDLSLLKEFQFKTHIACLSLRSGESVSEATRPTSITGNYGIIGDDGSLTKIDATTIVNEVGSTYYNPVTNTSYDLSGWTYDYSTRTYNLTTADDNSVTVTYGDENVTINEGDTTYNVYYLVEAPSTDDDGSGSGDPGTGEDHTHDYTSEITTASSCLLPGVRTYTCSCGDTYTKSIPATGHAWTVLQQVNNSYDDTGQLVTTGYTVYECATCGEQYKSEDGSAPPNGSSGDSSEETVWDKLGNLLGTVVEGFLSLLDGLLGGLLDGLISLLETLFEKLGRVVEIVTSLFAEIPALFGGFLDFLGALFPFIPEDMMTVLTFGLVAVVAVGLWKAFRR